MNQTPWYKDAVFYQIYVRAFYDSNGDGHGDLNGITQKLDYLQTLGVDCIWLMPFYPSPLKDDGYDIADFYNIAEIFGSVDDLKALIEAAHARDIRIVMDLVLNHTSDEHPWFKASRSDRNSPYRDYYVWSDTDQKFAGTRIIFVDTEPSNWTWDEKTKQYYWHRFYASQPDLNYDNPKVQGEMLNVERFWLDLGIDGFRADAVPYLFEREETNCENLPETHIYLKKLRAFMDKNYPGRILLCEANQWPEDVRSYFGDGDEFHMGFHFPIMPRIYMGLKKGDVTDLLEIINRTPAIPENCQWCTFLRNHDELTLEMVTPEERQWMWEQYAPEPRMRLNLGIRRRLAPLLDNDRRKIELANSLLFTLPGSPVIYYGDEIGMGDNIWLDDRNGVRTPMQWDDSPNGGFTSAKPFAPLLKGQYGPQHVNVAAQMTDPDSLLRAMRRMIAARKQYHVFGWGSFEWIDAGTNSIAAYTRKYKNETMLILNNLNDQKQTVHLPFSEATNILSNETAPLESLTLQPFQYLWLLVTTPTSEGGFLKLNKS
ncbi:MAG: maltose alpha-D-glucosyltransferase [Chloroflexi bacterium]|nr:maltose alpha-D-glucosyltransferase [Chloroflexota bacterium]